jgi:hypothetical protein
MKCGTQSGNFTTAGPDPRRVGDRNELDPRGGSLATRSVPLTKTLALMEQAADSLRMATAGRAMIATLIDVDSGQRTSRPRSSTVKFVAFRDGQQSFDALRGISLKRFASQSAADQPVHLELNGRLEVSVHREVRMEIEEHPRPIRSVRDGSKEVRVLLDEHIAVLDGPDALQIEIKEVRGVAWTRPVGGSSHSLAVIDQVEAQSPGFLERGEVHHRMAGRGYGIRLVLAFERPGEAVRERRYFGTRDRWLCRCGSSGSHHEASSRPQETEDYSCVTRSFHVSLPFAMSFVHPGVHVRATGAFAFGRIVVALTTGT